MSSRATSAGNPDWVSLEVRRTIRAPAERLFAAWTEPARLMQWWGPAGVRCTGAEIDLRVGGAYRIANLFPDGNVLWIAGAFEEIARPHRLVYSWRLEPGVQPEERVTVRFERRDDATEVIVLHERIATPELRDRHAHGWNGCLDGLERFLTAD
jgi:uncharacterized protein YndB with AHSA1/START domain